MPDATADPVAACLADVRERADAVVRFRDDRYESIVSKMRSAKDVPCLLAAVEAVLERHRPDGIVSKGSPCELHRSVIGADFGVLASLRRDCAHCTVVARARCWQSSCPDEWPCPDYQAITTALLGGTDE